MLNSKNVNSIKSKVEYLGHIISGKGIETDPKKIQSIRDWPTPTCTKDVQRSTFYWIV